MPTVANTEPWDSVPTPPTHRETSEADASAGKRSVQKAQNFALENSLKKAALAVSKVDIAQTSWKPRLPREPSSDQWSREAPNSADCKAGQGAR